MAAAGTLPSLLGATREAPDAAPFQAWCRSQRLTLSGCAVGDTPHGRGVLATRPIKAGEAVVRVPDSAVLMAESCCIAEALLQAGLAKETADDPLLEVQGLVLAVMHERALGAASRWAPYLAFLPEDMSHMPVYWTDAELGELRGTAAADKMAGRVQHPADAPTRVTQLFEELALPFVQAHQPACAALLGERAAADLSEAEARDTLWPLYLWATAAVASYSFVLGDDSFHGMVPAWDLLNHVTGAANVRLNHDAQAGELQMIASADIPAGAEVVNCFGQLSNAELLRGYGFVEPHNQLRHVQVPCQFLLRAAAAAGASGVPGAEAAAALDQPGAGSDPGSEPGSSGREGASEPGSSGSEGASEPGSSEGDGESSGGGESSEELDVEGLEDDSPSEQAAYLPGPGRDVPSLEAAQARVPDWAERWQLAHGLKLLPQTGVLQVSSGGLAGLPGQLLPLLTILCAPAAQCAALAEAAERVSSRAAAAAASSEQRAPARQGGGSSSKRHKAARNKATTAAAAGGSKAAAPTLADAAQELDGLQLASGDALAAALRHLAALLLARHTCSLEEDAGLLAKLGELPPRLAAAVLARSGEKEVLRQLQQALAAEGVGAQLLADARAGLADAMLQLAAAAAGAADEPTCGGESERSHTREPTRPSRKAAEAPGEGGPGEQGREQQRAAKKAKRGGPRRAQEEQSTPAKQEGFAFGFDL